MIGVGMRQCDLVSATAPPSGDDGPKLSTAPAGSGLLATGIAAGETGVLAALFPEFTIRRRLSNLAATGVSGVVSWSDLRHHGRARRRAATLGLPFLLFGPGLLRAPSRWATTTPILSVTARAMAGPQSPIDILDPDRLLASSGWESPGLLARAASLRREIVSRRLGGPWWNSGADRGLPRRGSYAFILGDGIWRQRIGFSRAARRHARRGQRGNRVGANRACGSGRCRRSSSAGRLSQRHRRARVHRPDRNGGHLGSDRPS